MVTRTALRLLACVVAAGLALAPPAGAQDVAATEGDAVPAVRVRGVATWRRYIWTLEKPLLDAVAQDLEAARSESPGTDTTRDFLLAYAHLAAGRRDEGVAAAERVQAAAPVFTGLRLLDGMVAILDRDDDQAAARFNAYLEGLRESDGDPNFAADLEMLGLLHRGAHAASIGRNQVALRDYNAAVAMARRARRRPATQLVQRLARVHQAEGEMGLAEELVIDLMKEDPGNANHYFNMGVLRAAQSDFDGARVWYLRALRRKPDFGDAHAKLAAVAAKQIRLVDMRRHLDAFSVLIGKDDDARLAEADAGYSDYYYRMSRQFDAEGREADRDEALRRFRVRCERALDKRPTCVRALELMIRAGSALGLSSAKMKEYSERLRGLDKPEEGAEGAFRRTLC